jgi:hypothetical protein
VVVALALMALAVPACTSPTQPPNIRISPDPCVVNIGQTVTLTLGGTMSPNAVASWSAPIGVVKSNPPGVTAIFVAPNVAGDVALSIVIADGMTQSPPINHVCRVIDPNTPTQLPLPGTTTVPTSAFAQHTIIISEVMANPCSDVNYKKWNEYVELYNYGDQPVDVGGWWLADNGPDNQPDEIIAWAKRNPGTSLGYNLVSDSTIIPPGRFALVISPIYNQGMAPYRMPYQFPAETILLTVAAGDRLGDDKLGLIGDGGSRDVVVLYIGGPRSIQEIVSTYGTPSLQGNYAQDIRDDHLDAIPLDLHDCGSAERINPLGLDVQDNWREVKNGSPGEAPY